MGTWSVLCTCTILVHGQSFAPSVFIYLPSPVHRLCLETWPVLCTYCIGMMCHNQYLLCSCTWPVLITVCNQSVLQYQVPAVLEWCAGLHTYTVCSMVCSRGHLLYWNDIHDILSWSEFLVSFLKEATNGGGWSIHGVMEMEQSMQWKRHPI